MRIIFHLIKYVIVWRHKWSQSFLCSFECPKLSFKIKRETSPRFLFFASYQFFPDKMNLEMIVSFNAPIHFPCYYLNIWHNNANYNFQNMFSFQFTPAWLFWKWIQNCLGQNKVQTTKQLKLEYWKGGERNRYKKRCSRIPNIFFREQKVGLLGGNANLTLPSSFRPFQPIFSVQKQIFFFKDFVTFFWRSSQQL